MPSVCFFGKQLLNWNLQEDTSKICAGYTYIWRNHILRNKINQRSPNVEPNQWLLRPLASATPTTKKKDAGKALFFVFLQPLPRLILIQPSWYLWREKTFKKMMSLSNFSLFEEKIYFFLSDNSFSAKCPPLQTGLVKMTFSSSSISLSRSLSSSDIHNLFELLHRLLWALILFCLIIIHLFRIMLLWLGVLFFLLLWLGHLLLRHLFCVIGFFILL